MLSTREPIPEEDLLEVFTSRMDEDLAAQVRAFQEAVAVCMKAKGFDYVPDVPATVSSDPGFTADEDWSATWGYGISIDTPAADAAGAPAGEVADPNTEYVASLSPEGRVAYQEALEGVGPGAPPPEGEAPDPSLLGCLTTAADALVACVVAAGGSSYDPLAGESPYDQVQQAYDDLTAVGDVAPAELAAFQDREREIAAAELRCTVPVLEAAQEVHDEVVREVVGPHRAELEALAEQWPDG